MNFLLLKCTYREYCVLYVDCPRGKIQPSNVEPLMPKRFLTTITRIKDQIVFKVL